MKRKLLSVLLTFCLAFSLLPTAALADGEGTPAPAEVPAAVGTALPAAVDGVITLGNDSYVMSEDTTATIKVPNGKNATLDLNGKTLTNKTGEHTIIVENGATLTITGNGIVDNVSHGKGAIVNSGEVTLNGGTFKGTVDLCADDDIYEKDKPTGNPNIALGLDKCFGYSAVVAPDGTFAGPNAYTAVLEKTGNYYEMWLKGSASKPVRIIPNAWGMKSVTLDGTKINYAKDWNLDAAFIDWMNNANTFCSTLVDRIVPGRIRDPKELAALEEANGYHDQVLDVGEVFGVWVIEGPAGLEDKLPFKKAGVNVMVVPDVTPYKKRKVRILNGAHTGFVLGAYLAGFDIVRDCMHNDTVRGFMNKMLHEEIIPTLPLDKKDLEEFASAVEDRFNNPFVNHELMSISLNSTSKWKARNMPSFLAYIDEQKKLPKCLTMSLAAYIAFYSNDIQERTADGLICKRPAGNTYKIQDDAWALDFYYAHKDDTAAQLVHAVLTNTQMWDQDLTQIEGLEAAVLADLEKIRTEGAEAAYKSCL